MDYFAQIEIMGYLRSSRDSDLFFSHEQVDFVVNNVKGNKLMHIDYILKDNLRTVNINLLIQFEFWREGGGSRRAPPGTIEAN